MDSWDDFAGEEQSVMITARDGGWLNEIIAFYLMRPGRTRAIWFPSRDVEAIRALIPRFTHIVKDMVERDLIDIREPGEEESWDSVSSFTGAELDRVLADPKTWIWSEDGDNRMVILSPTDRAYALLKRFEAPKEIGDNATKPN
jgi:hypothetical protein